MKSNYRIVHDLIHENSWKVREVYRDLLIGLYSDRELVLPTDKDYSKPENYFHALFDIVRLSGDLTEVQVKRIEQVYKLLIDNECEYYVNLLGETDLLLKEDPIRAIVSSGADFYHTMAHNLMVASYMLLLKIVHGDRFIVTGKKLEVAILTALFHDSVQTSDADKEMATWDESAVIAVLDQVYNTATRKVIVKEVLDSVNFTDYSNPDCAFYVDFKVGATELRADWGEIPEVAQMLIISDWLGQTVFAERRSRNIMVSFLYQYWLFETGNDKTHEFPMKTSIFRAVIECLLQMPEVFLVRTEMINDLRDEILYFHDTKTNIVQCFDSKRELYEMEITEALRMMHSYLSK